MKVRYTITEAEIRQIIAQYIQSKADVAYVAPEDVDYFRGEVEVGYEV